MTVRALVVDDSPTMRALVSVLLDRHPDIEVVGTAADAAQARTLIRELDPDVVTLDVEMPGMDGIEFLDKIMRLRPTPVVMVSTLTAAGTATTLRALELGAVDCVPKPGGASLGAMAAQDDGALARIVHDAAAARGRLRRAAPAAPAAGPPADYRPGERIVAIGASTGGVEALSAVLRGFPASCPPTLIVQHMPETFTGAFAARLDELCAATVREAEHGLQLRPGHVYLAPGGPRHMVLRGRTVMLVEGPMITNHRPAADALFGSVAKAAGAQAVGVILTGMGQDGARGLRAMREAGAATVGQDEASCVVYGMPRAAAEQGALTHVAPLDRIAARVLDLCRAAPVTAS